MNRALHHRPWPLTSNGRDFWLKGKASCARICEKLETCRPTDARRLEAHGKWQFSAGLIRRRKERLLQCGLSYRKLFVILGGFEGQEIPAAEGCRALSQQLISGIR